MSATTTEAREAMRAQIVETLDEHADYLPRTEPKNNADLKLGRTRYVRRCTCGEEMPWSQIEANNAHRAHLADVLLGLWDGDGA